jgi:hypothetical protein
MLCHDCGRKEGQLHVRGCDMELCPFCGGQLICCLMAMGCSIVFERLGKGAQHEDIEKLLTEEGRIPFGPTHQSVSGLDQ